MAMTASRQRPLMGFRIPVEGAHLQACVGCRTIYAYMAYQAELIAKNHRESGEEDELLVLDDILGVSGKMIGAKACGALAEGLGRLDADGIFEGLCNGKTAIALAYADERMPQGLEGDQATAWIDETLADDDPVRTTTADEVSGWQGRISQFVLFSRAAAGAGGMQVIDGGESSEDLELLKEQGCVGAGCQ